MLKQKNSSTQGNVGMGQAIAYFTKLGYTISIPLNDCQPYDLIVDNGKQLLKIQIKTAQTNKVELRSKYGGKGKVSKHFNKNNIDYLFITTENNNYLIPSKDINVKSMLSISTLEKYIAMVG